MSLPCKKNFWFFIWLLVAGFLFTSSILNKVGDEKRILNNDQSTHVMASMSVWHDLDLRYSLDDLNRFNSLFPLVQSSREMFLFLKQNKDGEIYYAKPFLYACLSAPFYGLFGSSGFIVLNSMLLLAIAVLTLKVVKEVYGDNYGQLLTMPFVFLSPFLAWVSIAHPDLLIAFLLFSGAYLLLSGKGSRAAVAGGFILGLAIFEKVTFAIIIPFLLFAASQISWKIRLCALATIVLGWSIPTFVNILQDGNFLAYQGLRFCAVKAPFPLENGWKAPVKGITQHLFDASLLISGLLGNLKLLPLKVMEFLIGRQTGILWYFPIGTLFLATAMFIHVRAACFVLLGLFAHLSLNWLAFPTNGFGGMGSYGSRYLMQALPLAVIALIPCIGSPRAETISKSRFYPSVGIVFILAAIFLQNKVLPPSEKLVRNPSIYLTSTPAKFFPFEHSLLPAIPMYVSWFTEKSFDSSTQLYRTKGFHNGPIQFGKSAISSEIVLHQSSKLAPVPDLAINVTSPALVTLRSKGRILWQNSIDPRTTAVATINEDIFTDKYFDIISLKFLRWAAIEVNIMPLGDEVDFSLANISFYKKTDTRFVELNKIVRVGEFSGSGFIKRFGWSHDEPWGVWSDGPYADLLFTLPEIPESAIDIHFGVQSYVPEERPSQDVEVYVNGKLFDLWRFVPNSNKRRVIRIDHTSLADQKVNIGFRMLNPISPSKLGRGSDGRMLGIGLRDIRVVKAESENK